MNVIYETTIVALERAKTLHPELGNKRMRIEAFSIRFCIGRAWSREFAHTNLGSVMKAAVNSFSLRKFSSIFRHSSGWRAACSDGGERAQGNVERLERCTGAFIGLERRDLTSGSSPRWFTLTPPLSRSRIPSKYSRNQPRADRKGTVEATDRGSALGPRSKIRHGPNLAFKALNQTGLQDSTKSVVLGSLLGDSTLNIAKGKHSRTVRYNVSMSLFNDSMSVYDVSMSVYDVPMYMMLPMLVYDVANVDI
jgi:hypothetical protein